MPADKKMEKARNPERRNALKKLATGGAVVGLLGITGKWTRPVVDSMILPAHAQATNASLFTPYSADKNKTVPTTTPSPPPTTTSTP